MGPDIDLVLRKPLEARWASGESASLRSEDGTLIATLEIRPWYLQSEREPTQAWVVSWLDPSAPTPSMLNAVAEVPARAVDSDVRRESIVEASIKAIRQGPRPPAPRAPALPSGPTFVERFRQVELLMDAWAEAEHRLSQILRRRDSTVFNRYLALSDVLARTYTVNRTLQGMWNEVPVDIREDASWTADEKAVRAISHNESALLRFGTTYNPRTDIAFEAYFERQRTGKPYCHWTGHLLTGALQAEFFGALMWVRGQMTYRGVSDPIELWQYEDGVEPRWKWKDAEAITVDLASGKTDRMRYDRLLAGQDVLGWFSHLLDIFWEAKWSLRKLLRRRDTRRPGIVRP